MADLSSVSTNFFATASETFSNNLSSSISAGATTVPVNNASAYTTGDIVVLTVEPGTSNEATFIGQKDTGNQFINCVWTEGNTGIGHSAGASVIDYTAATHQAALVKGIKKFANQDGTLISSAVQYALNMGAESLNGWNALGVNVSTVAANGNRSYTMTFASDVSSILSEGMRLRTTRTTATTATCFSLDGSNDYFNKTSPAGMTFTDDFTVSAWVYLTAYTATRGSILTRFNGTSGFRFSINAAGQVELYGNNAGGGNYSGIISYQSVPLNRWAHIAAQLDMSTFTATTTTSYIMIDGKDVPASVSRGGTNPTALVQAGNLEISSENGGAYPLAGYLKDICIYNSKVTQATILDRMHQTPTGSETNLISAYTGANTTDLNTTNANNLTAQNGAVSGFASAPYGNRGVSTTLDYGLVMAVSGSSVTVQVPEGCTIPTTGGVSAVAYSTQASPYGFVTDKGRWAIRSLLNSSFIQATPVQNTWYNIGSFKLDVPTGGWTGEYSALIQSYKGSTGFGVSTTLSTGSSSETDITATCSLFSDDNATSFSGNLQSSLTSLNIYIKTATSTPYYLNARTVYTGVSGIFISNGRCSTISITPAGL